ncbi:MAG: SBBP repeat-containing protein [Acidobacteriota bacterium]
MRKVTSTAIVSPALTASLFFLCGLFWLLPLRSANVLPPGQNLRPAALPPMADSQSLNNATAQRQQQIAGQYSRQPLSFEANRGQAQKQVKFMARGNGYGLFLTEAEAVLVLRRVEARQTGRTKQARRHTEPDALRENAPGVVRLKPVGINPNPPVEALAELPGKTNYFIGADAQAWRTDVPTYARVKYAQIYPGIDLVYYGNQQKLEYDWIVAPGANPGQIRLSFPGSQRVQITRSGELRLTVPGGEVLQPAPVIYQQAGDEKRVIAGGYLKLEDGQVGFAIEDYDRSLPLVIDPVLIYSTYLGGAMGDDAGNAITVDEAGNAYITGSTVSTDFPVKNASACSGAGQRNVFVTKLDFNGVPVFSTYLGGSGDDVGYGIALDCSRNIYLTGYTTTPSPNSTCSGFPGTANAIQAFYGGGAADAFLAMLDGNGVLKYSTYLGGNQSDVGNGIALDAQGNAYVTGSTSSTNFRTTNQSGLRGTRDAFLVKLKPGNNSLLYSTYWGGTGSEVAYSVALAQVDGTRADIYITGLTDSQQDFQVIGNDSKYGGGASDAFLTLFKFDGNNLKPDYSTYLGGSGEDAGYAVAVAAPTGCGLANGFPGQVFVAGYTFSGNFLPKNPLPGVGAIGSNADGFIAKFNVNEPDANKRLRFSSRLGGNDEDVVNGIAVDRVNRVYLTGRTKSADFLNNLNVPVAQDRDLVEQPDKKDDFDAFAVALQTSPKTNPDDGDTAFLVHGTYLGGEKADEGFAIAVSQACNAYVTGNTASKSFLLRNESQGKTAGETKDAFVARIGGVLGINIGSGCDKKDGIANESIAVAYGQGLGNAQNQSNTKVEIISGQNQQATGVLTEVVFFASDGQVNFLIPKADRVPPGPAIVKIKNLADGSVSTGKINIARISPCIFTDASFNYPAAQLLRMRFPATVDTSRLTLPAQLPALGMVGKLSDRVSPNSLVADNRGDGTFVVSLPAELGDHLVTRLDLTRTQNGQVRDTWSTTLRNGAKQLGVAMTLNGAVLTPAADREFEFNLKNADGGFFLFAAETLNEPSTSFAPNDSFSLRLTFADQEPVTVPAENPVITYNGKLFDRVGANSATGDGMPDGVFTAVLPRGLGDRIATRIDLTRIQPDGQITDTWSTFAGSGAHALGVAFASSDATLANATVPFKISIEAGRSFVLFASDVDGKRFQPTDRFGVNIVFGDEKEAPNNPAELTLAFNGKLLDRLRETSFQIDNKPDAVFSLALPASLLDRVIARMELQRLNDSGGVTDFWSTNALSGGRVLGLAQTLNGPLLASAAGPLSLTGQGKLFLFAADTGDGSFQPDAKFRLKLNFADDDVVTVAPVELLLAFNGKQRDRVSFSTLAADSQRDGVFTVAFPASLGARVITRLDLTRMPQGGGAGEVWSTSPVSGGRILGVAQGLDAALLNAANMQLKLPLSPGGALALFASDNSSGTIFRTGDNFSLKVTFADDLPITVAAANPVLTFNGKLKDRVSATSLAQDGQLDGVLTLALPTGASDRTLTRLELRRSQQGGAVSDIWSTNPASGQKPLGVAPNPDAPLLASAPGLLSLSGLSSLTLYAADIGDLRFQPTDSLELTINFGEDAPVTVTPTNPVLTFNGKLQDRVSVNGLVMDNRRDGVFTVALPPSLGDRVVTQLELTRQPLGGGQGEVWSTASGAARPLGVATALNAASLANPAQGQFKLSVAAGGSFVLFASDSAANNLFRAGDGFSLKLVFADNSPVTVAASAPVVSFNGKLVDRIAPNALTADGVRDGVFTVAWPAGFLDRALTQIELRRKDGANTTDVWSTAPTGAAKQLGVALGIDQSLLNLPAGPFVFTPTAQGFVLFAADVANNRFQPAAAFELQLTFSDEVAMTVAVDNPVLTYNGKLLDRVSPTSLNTDGIRDGVFTVALPAGFGDRLITRLDLQRTPPGGSVSNTWSTSPESGVSSLGVAMSLANPSLLNAGSGAFAVDVAAGGSLVLFASDINGNRFQSSDAFSLKITFADDAPMLVAGTDPVVTYNGKLQDRLAPAAFAPDGTRDAVLTLALPAAFSQRLVERLTLTRLTTGDVVTDTWSTAAGSGNKLLGVARTVNDAGLLNSTPLNLVAGGSLVLFAADPDNRRFRPGDRFALEIAFTSGTPVTSTANLVLPVFGTNTSTPATVVPRMGATTPVTGITIPTLGTNMLSLSATVPQLGNVTANISYNIPTLGTSILQPGASVPVIGSAMMTLDKTIPRFGINNNSVAQSYSIPRFGRVIQDQATQNGAPLNLTSGPLAVAYLGRQLVAKPETDRVRDGAKAPGDVPNNLVLTPDGQTDFAFLAGLRGITGSYVSISSLMMSTTAGTNLWDTPPNSVPVLGAARTPTGKLINDLGRATGIEDLLEDPLGLRFFPISVPPAIREETLYLFGADNPEHNRLPRGGDLLLHTTLVKPTLHGPEALLQGGQPVQISLGPELGPKGVYTERVFLVIYATGLRNARAVTAEAGGIALPVTYSGTQGDLLGLDQVNIFLPRSLINRGEVVLQIKAEGLSGNPVKLTFGR